MRQIIFSLCAIFSGCSYYGLSGGSGCFAPGTLIMTPTGKVAIEKLLPDDQVISFDEATGQFTIGVVEGVIERNVTEAMRVVLDNGATMDVTPEHPILTINGSWTPVGELAVNEKLMAFDPQTSQTTRTLREILPSTYRGIVYNVKVRRYENAVVDGGIVAHFY